MDMNSPNSVNGEKNTTRKSGAGTDVPDHEQLDNSLPNYLQAPTIGSRRAMPSRKSAGSVIRLRTR